MGSRIKYHLRDDPPPPSVPLTLAAIRRAADGEPTSDVRTTEHTAELTQLSIDYIRQISRAIHDATPDDPETVACMLYMRSAFVALAVNLMNVYLCESAALRSREGRREIAPNDQRAAPVDRPACRG